MAKLVSRPKPVSRNITPNSTKRTFSKGGKITRKKNAKRNSK